VFRGEALFFKAFFDFYSWRLFPPLPFCATATFSGFFPQGRFFLCKASETTARQQLFQRPLPCAFVPKSAGSKVSLGSLCFIHFFPFWMKPIPLLINRLSPSHGSNPKYAGMAWFATNSPKLPLPRSFGAVFFLFLTPQL